MFSEFSIFWRSEHHTRDVHLSQKVCRKMSSLLNGLYHVTRLTTIADSKSGDISCSKYFVKNS